MNGKKTMAFAALIGGIAVILGALGAHMLEKYLDSNALKSFETAVRYQLFHAIVLLFIGLAKQSFSTLPPLISKFFFTGILLFSGSIYLLILLKHLNINFPSLLGLMTPIGGVLLILGWGKLSYFFIKYK